jgi:hypothetical protein
MGDKMKTPELKDTIQITTIGKIHMTGADDIEFEGFAGHHHIHDNSMTTHTKAMAMLDAFYKEAKRRVDLLPIEVPRIFI